MISLNGLPVIHLPLVLFPMWHLTAAAMRLFCLCAGEKRTDWKRELSTPIFLLPSEALARQTQAPLQRGITGRDVWVSGRVTYFFSAPLFGLLERAASCAAEHAARNVIPPDCRCRAPTSHRQMKHVCRMLRECSLLCMHVSSQHRRTPKMCSGVDVKFI